MSEQAQSIEVIETRSPAGTERFGRSLAGRLSRGDCVALVGDLGAGKTALVRGIAAGLGLDDRHMVSSPTFVLCQEYPARVVVYHLDLYRMSEPGAELEDLGLDEMLQEGVVLVEWADRAMDHLPRPLWQVSIAITGPRRRRFQIRRLTHSDAPAEAQKESP